MPMPTGQPNGGSRNSGDLGGGKRPVEKRDYKDPFISNATSPIKKSGLRAPHHIGYSIAALLSVIAIAVLSVALLVPQVFAPYTVIFIVASILALLSAIAITVITLIKARSHKKIEEDYDPLSNPNPKNM